MSEVKVNKLSPRSGTTVTIGDSGDTINIVGTLQNNGSALPGDISSVVAGTGLSGGGTTGVVTLNIEAAQPTITSTGTLTGFTSTGIDDNATSTAITIDSNGDITFLDNTTARFFYDTSLRSIGINTTSPQSAFHVDASSANNGGVNTATEPSHVLTISSAGNGGSGRGTSMVFQSPGNGNSVTTAKIDALQNSQSSTASNANLVFNVANTSGSLTRRLSIGNGGDISFYEDTGTTPKLFWDSSTERLGIGTSSPSSDFSSDTVIEVAGSTSPGLVINDTGQASKYSLHAVSADFVMNYGSTAFFRYKPGDSQITAHDNLKIITGTSSGVTPNTIADKLFIDGVGNQGLTIGSGNTSVGSVVFADDGDNDIGKLQYNHNDNSMSFTINASERMRITSDGELLVGKTANNSTVVGATIERLGNIGLTALIQANRKDSDGDLINFLKDNTAVGSIGGYSNDLYLGTTDTGLKFNDFGDYITPFNPSTLSERDNAIGLGTTTSRFTDLYLSGGAFIGGTGTANKLDDYEEGTWTPSATFANDTASGQNGQYTKIGNVVTATFNIVFSSTSFGIQISVAGLPFTSHNVSGSNSAGFGRQAYYDGTSTNLSLAVLNNSTQVDLYENATALQNNSDKILGKNLRATVVYRTA